MRTPIKVILGLLLTAGVSVVGALVCIGLIVAGLIIGGQDPGPETNSPNGWATVYAREGITLDDVAGRLCPDVASAGTPGAGTSRSRPVVWCFSLGTAPSGGVFVADGDILYVADFGHPTDSRPVESPTLHALDAATGAERWRVRFGKRQRLSEPVPAGGRVHVCLTLYRDYSVEYARVTLDRASGDEIQRAGVQACADQATARDASAVADGVRYFRPVGYTPPDLALCAADAESNRLRWQLTVGPGDFAPVVANGLVYIDGFSGPDVNQVIYAINVRAAAGVAPGALSMGETEASPPRCVPPSPQPASHLDRAVAGSRAIPCDLLASTGSMSQESSTDCWIAQKPIWAYPILHGTATRASL